MSDLEELIPFNNLCDEFVSGKYILADIKISSILKLVENDEKVKNIISSSCDGYNFQLAFNKAISNTEDINDIKLPSFEKEIIAFVYNLLVAFKNGNINFYDFLNKYFPGENSSYNIADFSNTIIIPFKDAINSMFAKSHVIVESDDFQNNIYNKLKSTISLILNNIDAYKLKLSEKEEFTILLNSLYSASDKNDKNLAYALIIGLDYFSKTNKKTRIAYLSLEECFA